MLTSRITHPLPPGPGSFVGNDIPRRLPESRSAALTKPAVLRHCRIQVNTARCVSSAIKRRVREIVEWVRRRLVQPDAKKIAQRQRVCRTPGDAALGVNPLEIANQQPPEIDPRRQARPAHRLCVKARALSFSENRRSRARAVADSTVGRRDDSRPWANPSSPPTSAAVDRVGVCLSPCGALYVRCVRRGESCDQTEMSG